MAPSSSGPGHQVLILKIAGSNPAGVTIQTAQLKDWAFCMALAGYEPIHGFGVRGTER